MAAKRTEGPRDGAELTPTTLAAKAVFRRPPPAAPPALRATSPVASLRGGGHSRLFKPASTAKGEAVSSSSGGSNTTPGARG